MKSGSLNFMEHSGPLQACNGTGLPLPFTGTIYIYLYAVRMAIFSDRNSVLFLCH